MSKLQRDQSVIVPGKINGKLIIYCTSSQGPELSCRGGTEWEADVMIRFPTLRCGRKMSSKKRRVYVAFTYVEKACDRTDNAETLFSTSDKL